MQDLFNVIVNSNEFEIIVKLVLVVILSGAIGMERASLSKPAGFKTHVLLGISAVLTVLCGKYLYEQTGSDLTRIPAQLLSGIGFLGAGTILRDGFNVKGLTTAASLLAVTCIGLCVGAGLYIGSILATLIVYIILSYSNSFSDKITHYNDLDLTIETTDSKKILEDIQGILEKYKIEIKNIIIDKDGKNADTLKLNGRYRDEINKNEMLSELMNLEEVNKILEI